MTRSKKWRVAATPERADRRREAYIVTAYPADRTIPVNAFVTVEGEELPDPTLTPAQAERLGKVLLKAAAHARARS